MMNLRKSSERGLAEHGWLKSFHTFSFASYHDENFMGFRDLRVINEDRIQGGTGFSTHPHRDMEIISYVIEGALEHKDTIGNSTIIRPDEVQRMSAGSGISHSEKNHLADQTTHFLQIWILTEKNGVPPSYDQKSFSTQLNSGELILVGSRDGRKDSVVIFQNVDLYAARPKASKEFLFPISKGRHLWVQMIKGQVLANNIELNDGDGLAVSDEKEMKLKAAENSEFLLFDLA
jgi:redox-sensitive bicupin YhaK (pirin superfamily)